MNRARVERVDDHGDRYIALMFACPGCASTREGYDGLHLLPITGSGTRRPVWTFGGSLEAPTLSPSILTRGTWADVDWVCHSFLRAGRFEFLGDCTHELVGQTVELPPLPTWTEEASTN